MGNLNTNETHLRRVAADVVGHLRALRNEQNIAGMARFGIRPAKPLGIPITTLRAWAKRLGRNHKLSELLWSSGLHEVRILAALVAEPEKLSPRTMNARAAGFDSWDLCDQWCQSAFWRSAHAWTRARLWTRRRGEFVKRAGLVLLAVLAVHNRSASDEQFLTALTWVEREAADSRHYVSKAVSWALRQIGKRNVRLRRAVLAVARRMAARDSRTARSVAAEVLWELGSRRGA